MKNELLKKKLRAELQKVELEALNELKSSFLYENPVEALGGLLDDLTTKRLNLRKALAFVEDVELQQRMAKEKGVRGKLRVGS
jgi:hypothetical protein